MSYALSVKVRLGYASLTGAAVFCRLCKALPIAPLESSEDLSLQSGRSWSTLPPWVDLEELKHQIASRLTSLGHTIRKHQHVTASVKIGPKMHLNLNT